jgi:DNA-binding CsgD family transcriptional regulator
MRLSRTDEGAVTLAARTIRTLPEDDRVGLRRPLELVSDMLQLKFAATYGIQTSEHSVDLRFCHWGGLPDGPDVAEHMGAYFRSAQKPPRLRFGAFDPRRPEPWQRNRIIDWPMVAAKSSQPPPIACEVFPALRVKLEEQIRVLVCDGPSLLAWVGGFREAPFDARGRTLFQRLVSPLRDRLRLERALDAEPGLRASLAAALEAIPHEAFIVNDAGAPLHGNSLAKAWLDRHPRTGRRALVGALRGASVETHFTVARIAVKGASPHYLLVARAAPDVEARARAAARRWGLSPRQAEVLKWIARGDHTARIGVELGISDRTVESHVEAIFAKADVASRSQLVAAMMRLS